MDMKSDDNLPSEKELKAVVGDLERLSTKGQENILETAEQKGNVNVNKNQTVEDYPNVQSILFVSQNNICRAPMAKAIACNYIIRNLDEKKWAVSSAAVSKRHVGEMIDIRASEVLMKHTIFNSHICREVTQEDLRSFQNIFCIDETAFRNVKSILPEGVDESKIKLLGTLIPGSCVEFEDLSYNVFPNDEKFEQLFQKLYKYISYYFAPFQKSVV